MIIVLTFVKDFNADLLREQLEAQLPGRVSSILWAGFDWNGIRKYVPIGAPRIIATTSGPGGTITDTAQPGELRFTVPDDFSPAEETTLSNLLTAHDATQFTAEQTRRLVDLSNLNQIRVLFDIGPLILQPDLVQLVRLLARHVLREARKEALG